MLTGDKIKDLDLKDLSVFVALGIDFTGTKHILGFWPLKGRKSKVFWIEVLQDLINRGLKRPLLFVTDDFRGLTEVIKQLFPYAQHQLFLLHLQRNLKAKLPSRTYRKDPFSLNCAWLTTDRKVKNSLPKSARWSKKNTSPGAKALKTHYLAFLDYRQEVRKHIYSTNPVESINAGLEKMAMEQPHSLAEPNATQEPPVWRNL